MTSSCIIYQFVWTSQKEIFWCSSRKNSWLQILAVGPKDKFWCLSKPSILTSIQTRFFDACSKRGFLMPVPNKVFQRPFQTRFFDARSKRGFSTPIPNKVFQRPSKWGFSTPVPNKVFRCPSKTRFPPLHCVPSCIAYHPRGTLLAQAVFFVPVNCTPKSFL